MRIGYRPGLMARRRYVEGADVDAAKAHALDRVVLEQVEEAAAGDARVRTVGDEIAGLKKTLPEDAAAAAGSAVAKQIDELTSTRKELVAGKFKDKHANMGYLLLALGVTLAVEGGMNTYLRVGKLFPGPHLYAGASIVVLWAMAAGLVPQMEKGNQKARDLHIALNCVNLALFTWQIPTGLEIVGKVFQFTSWP